MRGVLTSARDTVCVCVFFSNCHWKSEIDGVNVGFEKAILSI